MRIITFIIISFCLVQGQSYRPLSGKDKKLFERSYKDLKTAYSNNDFKTYQYFADKILIEYENILLDPSSSKLRPKYLEIDSLNKSLTARVNAETKRSEMILGSPILTYDQLINLYKNVNRDSTIKYQGKLNKTIDSIIQNKMYSLEFYREANICKNIPDSSQKIIRKGVEVLFQEKFLELSSKLDYKEIDSFEKNYPEIYKQDVKELKEKAKMKERLTNIRYPEFNQYDQYIKTHGKDEELKNVVKKHYRKSLLAKLDLETFEEYYRRFPEDDFELFANIEDKLYQTWLKKGMNETDGATYLKYFPQGRYVFEVNNKKQQSAAAEDEISQKTGE